MNLHLVLSEISLYYSFDVEVNRTDCRNHVSGLISSQLSLSSMILKEKNKNGTIGTNPCSHRSQQVTAAVNDQLTESRVVRAGERQPLHLVADRQTQRYKQTPLTTLPTNINNIYSHSYS